MYQIHKTIIKKMYLFPEDHHKENVPIFKSPAYQKMYQFHKTITKKMYLFHQTIIEKNLFQKTITTKILLFHKTFINKMYISQKTIS